jgi:hypothetical protein
LERLQIWNQYTCRYTIILNAKWNFNPWTRIIYIMLRSGYTMKKKFNIIVVCFGVTFSSRQQAIQSLNVVVLNIHYIGEWCDRITK